MKKSIPIKDLKPATEELTEREMKQVNGGGDMGGGRSVRGDIGMG